MTEVGSAPRDPCRPLYHYSSGLWMNDVMPFHDGETLHVFFNHNPKVANRGRFHWGHATTRDLVTWTTEPLALSPTPEGPDALGIWTGAVVATPDGAAALYTGIPTFDPFTQVQCLATSTDLVTWRKRPEPILAAPPPGFGHCFRDPYLWQVEGVWHMLVGSTLRDADVAAVLHYVSPDLHDWDFVGPVYVGDDGALGREAECPELFELDGRHVLVASDEQTRALVGAVDDKGRFVPDRPVRVVDPGASYAARSVAIGGRRIQIGWVRDTRDRDASEAAGWRGALSIPRELSLDGDGRLSVLPVPEMRRLRAGVLHHGAVPLDRTRTPIPGVDHLTVELLVDLEPRQQGRSGIVVACDPDGADGVEVAVDWANHEVAGQQIDTIDPAVPLRLHVFVDQSVVEAFVQGTLITLRHYDLPDAPRIATWTDGSPSSCHVTAWELGLTGSG